MKAFLIFVIAYTSFGASPLRAAAVNHMVVGVNVTNNDGTLSQAFQEDEIKHLVETV